MSVSLDNASAGPRSDPLGWNLLALLGAFVVFAGLLLFAGGEAKAQDQPQPESSPATSAVDGGGYGAQTGAEPAPAEVAPAEILPAEAPPAAGYDAGIGTAAPVPPVPYPAPAPAAETSPGPAPIPAPAPETVPAPIPEPAPQPLPEQSYPEPLPEPAPEPLPEPLPEPAPDPSTGGALPPEGQQPPVGEPPAPEPVPGQVPEPVALEENAALPPRTEEEPIPRPLVPVPDLGENDPYLPSSLWAVCSNAAEVLRGAGTSALDTLTGQPLFGSATEAFHSAGTGLSAWFFGGQAELAPDGVPESPGPPSAAGSGDPSGGAPQPLHPATPTTVSFSGPSSGSGTAFGGSGAPLLLLCVLLSALSLLRRDAMLWRILFELPRPRSALLPALERPG